MRAARHYAQAASSLIDPIERAFARDLIAAAAVNARQASAFAKAEELLAVALELLPPDPWTCEPAATCSLHTEQHLVRFCLGRYSEADVTYAQLNARADQVTLADAACIQVMSLSNRTRYGDAVALARELLGRLGIMVPADEVLMPDLQEELARFYAHVERGGFDQLPHSPALTDAQRIKTIRLLSRRGAGGLFRPAAGGLLVRAARVAPVV